MVDKKPKRITLGLIISWVFGILFGLNTLAYLVYRQFVPAIISLVVFVVIFPPISKLIQEKFNIELSKGIKIAVVIIGLIIIAFTVDVNQINQQSQTSDQEVLTQPKTQEKPKEIRVISNSFDDFSILCDSDVTNLQKKDFFDKNFKDNYVEWTGEVSSISESFGQYVLQVKHCPLTFTSDIMVTMKKDQKDKLLSFKEGDTVTYRAKLTRIGDILGMSATDGEIIKVEEKREEKSNEITGDVVKETKQESETTEVKQEVQSNKGYENTKNGITLTVKGYNFEKKTDTYGKLKDVSIVIYNHQGSDYISPDLLIHVVDKKDSKLTILKKVELSEYIDTGESVHRTVEVDLGIAGIDNPKEMRISVIKYTDDIFVTVYFNTNLLEGFKTE